MRLYAAMAVPLGVRTELAVALAPLRAAAPPALRWTRAEDWHVTLAFYGQVADERVDELTARLRRAVARRPSPVLRTGALGCFGPDRAATVLWVGVDADRELLRSLAASARAAGRRVGLGGADVQPHRPFRAHLTLARDRRGADLRDLLADPRAGRPSAPLGWRADEVVLVRSDLGAGPGGTARHTVLARLPFRPAGGPDGQALTGST